MPCGTAGRYIRKRGHLWIPSRSCVALRRALLLVAIVMADLPSTAPDTEVDPSSPDPESHEYDDGDESVASPGVAASVDDIQPLAVWTRNEHLLDDSESEYYDRCVRKDGSDCLKTMNNQGLCAVPVGLTEQKQIPKPLLHPHIDSSQLVVAPRAGKRLQQSMDIITRVLDHGHTVKIFKIGYAANPAWRLAQYRLEDSNYTDMTLLDWSFDLGMIQMEEAALIQIFGGEMGCRNEASGGEGRPKRSRVSGQRGFFLYVTWGSVGPRVSAPAASGPRKHE